MLKKYSLPLLVVSIYFTGCKLEPVNMDNSSWNDRKAKKLSKVTYIRKVRTIKQPVITQKKKVRVFNKAGYDQNGFDRFGYNALGYNRYGFDSNGFDKNGYNRFTGTKYNKEGYNKEGYNRQGFNKQGYNKYGYNKYGYNKEGYNKYGFNSKGIFKDTGTRYNKQGFNIYGYNKEGFNRLGYDIKGYDKYGFNKKGYNAQGYDKYGLTKKEIKLRYKMSSFRDRPIKFTIFNDQRYLHVDIEPENIYDMSKLNTYDILKLVVSSKGRDMLEKLYNHFNDVKDFYGYDIEIIVHKTDYVLRDKIAKILEQIKVINKDLDDDEKIKISFDPTTDGIYDTKYRISSTREIAKTYLSGNMNTEKFLNSSNVNIDNKELNMRFSDK